MLIRTLITVFLLTTTLSVVHTQSAPVEELGYASQLKGDSLFNAENFNEALTAFLEAIEKGLEADNQALIAKNTYKVAKSHLRLSNDKAALQYYLRYLDFPEPITEEKQRMTARGRIAVIYRKRGEYNEAYSYQLGILRDAEQKKDSTTIISSFYELGTLFYYEGTLTKSLENYNKAIELSKAPGKDLFLLTCYGGIGSTYEKMEALDTALTYYNLAVELAEELNRPRSIANAYQNLGACYVKMGNRSEARFFLEKALRLYKEQHNTWGQIGCFEDFGELAVKSQKYNPAIDYFITALDLAKSSEAKEKISSIFKSLAEVYKLKGDHKNALIYMEAFSDMQDSIKSEAMLREMGEAQSLYEVQKREDEIVLLKREGELNEKRREITKAYNYVYIAIIIGFIIASILALQWYRGAKRSKIALEEKNEKIQWQNKRLEHFNAELQNFAYVASHDLKEPLRTVGSFSSLLERKLGDNTDESIKKYLYFISDGVNRMNLLVTDLLNYSRIDKVEKPTESVDIENVINTSLHNLQEVINENEASIRVSADLPKVIGIQSQLVRLFQNLISNAIKFRGEKTPRIVISCATTSDRYIFSVKDNGLGIKEEYKDKVFQMFMRLHTSNQAKGTGIGLASCKKIVEFHQGKIWLSSKPGEGTSFFFSLPKEIEQVQMIEKRA